MTEAYQQTAARKSRIPADRAVPTEVAADGNGSLLCVVGRASF